MLNTGGGSGATDDGGGGGALIVGLTVTVGVDVVVGAGRVTALTSVDNAALEVPPGEDMVCCRSWLIAADSPPDDTRLGNSAAAGPMFSAVGRSGAAAGAAGAVKAVAATCAGAVNWTDAAFDTGMAL